MAAGGEHDWEIIGQRDPYFGVLSSPDFRTEAITPERRESFYATGEDDIARLMTWFDQDVGVRPSTGRALDIGCGVGRLVYAMARIVPQVSGYDIAESMLAIAREHAPANTEFSTTLPQGPFSWINSYIVFQHIPPEEGLKVLDTVLARATPDCFLSVQFTFWRDHAQPRTNPISKLRQRMVHDAGRKADGDAAHLIRMHDYSMNDVMRRVMAAGFNRIALRHTNHGGHHGAWLIGRRG